MFSVAPPPAPPPALAFVFPGQGAQKVGMGAELAKLHPLARATFDEADAALGICLSKLCFEGPDADLQLTANAQPAILTTSIALLRVLQARTGLTPGVVAGHSLGEYSALVCAGALPFADAVRAVNQRGAFMQDAVPAGVGAMAAVMGASIAEVEALCLDAAQGQTLQPANFNGAGQVVIAGHTQAVSRACELGKQRGAACIPLKVSAPFHSPLMAPAADKLMPLLATLPFADAQLPIISNVNAVPYTAASVMAGLLYAQVTAAVRWEDSVKRLAAMGVTHVIEIGPGKALTSLLRRIDPSIKGMQCETSAHIDALAQSAELAPYLQPLVAQQV